MTLLTQVSQWVKLAGSVKDILRYIRGLRPLWREWTGMRRELRFLRWAVIVLGLILVALSVTIVILILRLD